MRTQDAVQLRAQAFDGPPHRGGRVAQVGADAESDANLVKRLPAKWGTRAAGGATGAVSTGTPQSAYEYWARSADSSITKVAVYTALYPTIRAGWTC